MWTMNVPETDRAGWEAAVDGAEVVRAPLEPGETLAQSTIDALAAEEDEQAAAARVALKAAAAGFEESVMRLWGSASGHACREDGGADSMTVTVSEVAAGTT